jgi:hypothetical protein
MLNLSRKEGNFNKNKYHCANGSEFLAGRKKRVFLFRPQTQTQEFKNLIDAQVYQ